MSRNLIAAHKEWAKRPADERFWTLDDLRAACYQHYQNSQESRVEASQLRVDHDSHGEVTLVAPTASGAFTNWSFGQLSSRMSLPIGGVRYLRSLPAALAAPCLDYHLKAFNAKTIFDILFHNPHRSATPGLAKVSAFTSDRYSRIWDYEVVDTLLPLGQHGWRTPPARVADPASPDARLATLADISGLVTNIKVGDVIGPAGLYASDRDLFVFLVNPNLIVQDGAGDGLGRGIFVSNSEVGAGSLKITRFLYRYVCGNHIVWGAKGVQQSRLVHVGASAYRFANLVQQELRAYSNESCRDEERRIAEARNCVIASDDDEIVPVVARSRIDLLTFGRTRAATELARLHGDDPLTAWGLAQGFTRLSQLQPNTDQRTMLDRATGELLNYFLN